MEEHYHISPLIVTLSGHFHSQLADISPLSAHVKSSSKCQMWKRGEKKPRQENVISPQPLLLFLPQLHVTLNHFQHMLCLVICQARQVQLASHRPWPRHTELLLVKEGRKRRRRTRRRRVTGVGAQGAEAGTTLWTGKGNNETNFLKTVCEFGKLIYSSLNKEIRTLPLRKNQDTSFFRYILYITKRVQIIL